MNIAKLAVLLGAIVLASGGIGAALAETRNSGAGGVEPIDIEARKNENDDGVLLFADDDNDDDDSTNGIANTGDATNNGTGGSQAALVEGRSAAEWMASANLYKQRWMQMKQANNRHAQQVRNLRSALRPQVRSSAGPRIARGGSVARGGGGTNTGGGGTNTGGGSVSGGGDT